MQPENEKKPTSERNKTALIEDCRHALKCCPHERGTVSVMCHMCLGRDDLFVWDVFQEMFLYVDCPRCHRDLDNDVAEVCPCLEDVDKEVILRALGRHEKAYPELSEAVRWMRLGAHPKESSGRLPRDGRASRYQDSAASIMRSK